MKTSPLLCRAAAKGSSFLVARVPAGFGRDQPSAETEWAAADDPPHDTHVLVAAILRRLARVDSMWAATARSAASLSLSQIAARI